MGLQGPPPLNLDRQASQQVFTQWPHRKAWACTSHSPKSQELGIWATFSKSSQTHSHYSDGVHFLIPCFCHSLTLWHDCLPPMLLGIVLLSKWNTTLIDVALLKPHHALKINQHARAPARHSLICVCVCVFKNCSKTRATYTILNLFECSVQWRLVHFWLLCNLRHHPPIELFFPFCKTETLHSLNNNSSLSPLPTVIIPILWRIWLF